MYKRLSKSTTSVGAAQKERTLSHPSTPPRTTRRKHSPSILLSKSRAVETTTPLAAFNPFSPRKKQKGKERQLPSDNEERRQNLFSNFESISANQEDGLSLDPFPPTQTPSSSRESLSPSPKPISAVSRARKRLRGEPVSPSPVKEKKRRVKSQNAVLFPCLNLDSIGSGDEVDAQDVNSSFVDNSPVKVPTSGKLFAQLFTENTLAPTDLFGVQGNPDNVKADKKNSFIPTRRAAGTESLRKVARKPSRGGSKIDAFPGHLDTRPIALAMSRANSELAINQLTDKRPDTEVVETVRSLPRSKSPLIPPSPPPSATANNRPPKHLLKSQASKSRKKAKTEKQNTSDSDEVEQHAKPKVVKYHTTHIRRAGSDEQFEDSTEYDIDSVFGHTRFGSPRAPMPDITQQEGGIIEVNLPDKLQRVLALDSVAPQSRIPDQDNLVKSLLYGRRTTHYDPRRGGEIWDIGEDHFTSVDEGGTRGTSYAEEEDWEEEPVPWDIAEL